MATRKEKQVIQVIEQGLDEILAKIKQLNQEKKKASGSPVNVKASNKSTQSVQNQAQAVGTLGSKTQNTSKNVGELGRNMKGTAQITSNQTKAFAKQSQGMGGLVAAYATLAANVFAATAAFNALRRASEFQKVIQGAQAMSQQLGISVNSMVEDLRLVTNNAISMEAAFRASAQAATASVSANAFRELAVVAKGAAVALGRDVQDSLDRLSRGVIKLEPELLDEIGIMVRLDDAVSEYAKQVGKAASDVTFLEKRQAFQNAVLDQGIRKFGELSKTVEASEFSQLAARFQDLSKGVLGFANNALEPVIATLLRFPGAFEAALGLFAASIFKRAVPAISQMKATGLEAAAAMEQAALQQRELLQGNVDLRGALAKSTAKQLSSQITNTVGGIADSLEGFERAGEDIAPGTTKLVKQLDKQADISIDQLQKVRGELDKSIQLRQTALEKTENLSRAERVRRENILDDVKNVRKATQNAIDLKEQQIRAEDRVTRAVKLSARERAAVRRVEIQQQAAVNKQLIATLGDTTRIEGTRAAFSRLRTEMINTANTGIVSAGRIETAFVRAGAGARAALLGISGAARIAFANLQLLMGVFGTIIGALFILRPLIERVGKGLGVISNLSDDAASSLDRAEENAQNFATGLERIDRIGADSIAQLSSNFSTLSNVIKSSNEDLQALSDIDLSSVNVNTLFGRDQSDIQDELVTTLENIRGAAERAGPEFTEAFEDILSDLGAESIEDIKDLEVGTEEFTDLVRQKLPEASDEFLSLAGDIGELSSSFDEFLDSADKFNQEFAKFGEQIAPSTSVDELVKQITNIVNVINDTGVSQEISKIKESIETLNEVSGSDVEIPSIPQEQLGRFERTATGAAKLAAELKELENFSVDSPAIFDKFDNLDTEETSSLFEAAIRRTVEDSDISGIATNIVEDLKNTLNTPIGSQEGLSQLIQELKELSSVAEGNAESLESLLIGAFNKSREEAIKFANELKSIQASLITNQIQSEAAAEKVKLFGEALGFDSPDLLSAKFKEDLDEVDDRIKTIVLRLNKPNIDEGLAGKLREGLGELERQRTSIAEQRELSKQIAEIEREKATTLDEEAKILLDAEIRQAKLNVALQGQNQALRDATKQLEAQTDLKLEQFRLEERLQDIQIGTERITTSFDAQEELLQNKQEELDLEKERQQALGSLNAVDEARIDNQSRLLQFRERELDTQKRIAQTVSDIISINEKLASSSTSPQDADKLKERRSVLLDNLEILNNESASLEQQRKALQEIFNITSELAEIELFKEATESITEAANRLSELTGNEFADAAASAAESFALAAERAAELELGDDDIINALGDVIGHFADATASLEQLDGTFGDIAQGLSGIQGALGVFDQIQNFPTGENFLTQLTSGLGIATSLLSIAGGLLGGGPSLSEEEIDAIQESRRREDRTGALGTDEEKVDSISQSLENIEKINFDTFSQGAEMVLQLKKLNNKFEDVSTLIASEGVSVALTSFSKKELQDLVRSGLDVISNKNNKGFRRTVAKFGDDITEVVSAGIKILGASFNEIVESGLSARLFVDFSEEGGLFDDADFRQVEFLDDNLVNRTFLNQVRDVILDTAETITEFGEQLGFTQEFLQNRLETFTLGEFTLDLTGDLEERREELQSFFSTVANDLVSTVIPGIEEFQKAGEELFETLTRVVQTQLIFEQGLSLIGKDFEDFVNFSEDTIQQTIDNLTFEIRDPDAPRLGVRNLFDEGDFAGGPTPIPESARQAVDPTQTIEASAQDAIALLAIQWRESVIEALGGPEGEELQEVFKNFAEGLLTDTQLLSTALTNVTENLGRGFSTLIESAGGADSELFEGFDPTSFTKESFLEFFQTADFTEFPEAFAEALKIGEVIGTVEKLVTDLFNTLGLDNLVQAQEDAINTLSEGLADTARGEAQRRLDRALSDLGVESFSEIFPAIQESGGIAQLSANQVESLNDATEALGDIARAAADKIVGAIQQAKSLIATIDTEIESIRQNILSAGGTVTLTIAGVEQSFTGLSGAARLASLRLDEAQNAFNNAIGPFAIIEQGQGLIQSILDNMQAQQTATQQSAGAQQDFSDQISEVEDRLSDLKSLLEDIKDFLVDIRLDENLSPLTPFEQLQFSQDNFTNALNDLAEQLDLDINFSGIQDLTGSTFQQAIGQLAGNLDELSPDAQENIVDFARQFLDQARSAFGGSAQFESIFNSVVSTLEGLGLSISGEIGNLEDQLSELEQFQQAQQTREQSLAVQQQSLSQLQETRDRIAEAERIVGELTELAEAGLLFDENGNLQSERILQVEGFTKEMFENTDWGPFKDLQATALTPDVVDLVGGPEGTNSILKDILAELRGFTEPLGSPDQTDSSTNTDKDGGITVPPPPPPPGPQSTIIGPNSKVLSDLNRGVEILGSSILISNSKGKPGDEIRPPGGGNGFPGIGVEPPKPGTKPGTKPGSFVSPSDVLTKFVIDSIKLNEIGSGPFGGKLFEERNNTRFFPDFTNRFENNMGKGGKEDSDGTYISDTTPPGDGKDDTGDNQIGPLFNKLDRTLNDLPRMIDRLVTIRLKQRK